jgi:hypothetical protein
MVSVSEFAKRIRKRGQKIEINANKEVVQLGSLVSQAVITATPVDTGRAKGNWFATLGSPTSKTDLESLDPSGQKTISQNNSVIKGRLPLQAIYITNNLPYIKRLNEGWSGQAPAGYVENALREAKVAMKNIRLLK